MLVQLAKPFEKRPWAFWGMTAVSAIYGPGTLKIALFSTDYDALFVDLTLYLLQIAK